MDERRAARRELTLRDFEARCAATPDLELSPLYWNNLLPEITGYAIWVLWVAPGLRMLQERHTGT